MKTQQQAPYPLRLDIDLKQWLKERARENDRSFNAEINQLLKQARRGEQQNNGVKS